MAGLPLCVAFLFLIWEFLDGVFVVRTSIIHLKILRKVLAWTPMTFLTNCQSLVMVCRFWSKAFFFLCVWHEWRLLKSELWGSVLYNSFLSTFFPPICFSSPIYIICVDIMKNPLKKSEAPPPFFLWYLGRKHKDYEGGGLDCLSYTGLALSGLNSM